MTKLYLGSEPDKSRYQVSLVDSRGESFVSGITLQNEISVSGSNNFGSISDLASNLGGNLFSSAVSKLTTIRDISGVVGKTQYGTAKSLTRVVWQGSDVPSFTLNLTFVCLSSGNDFAKYDVRKKVNAIMKYVYPEKKERAGVDFLTAPAGYKIAKGSRGNSGEGQFTVSVGNWFSAKNQVMLSANFDYSKEVNRLGSPIYATGTITFRPSEAITYSEFEKYFVGA